MDDRQLLDGFGGSISRRAFATARNRALRFLLVGVATVFLLVVVAAPLGVVFFEALRLGWPFFWSTITSREAFAALALSLTVLAFVIPINVVFGLAAAWALSKFDFRWRSLLISLIDLPFAVSPVVSGFALVLLFGPSGWIGPWLSRVGLQVLFSTPGIVLATLFVTLPMIARQLIALMEAQGRQEEETALSLGASGLRTFLAVTAPNVRWALLYGVVLCAARSLGEFGAVSVVSGHIRGVTMTMPLHVEELYNDNKVAAAFSVASVLALISACSLIAKILLERRLSEDAMLPDGHRRGDDPK